MGLGVGSEVVMGLFVVEIHCSALGTSSELIVGVYDGSKVGVFDTGVGGV